MTFIIGLGNPGEHYRDTRHNVGQVVLDNLAQKLQAPNFKFQTKTKSQISKSSNLILVKPETFMNESGLAVRAVLDYYNPQQYSNITSASRRKQFDNLYVIHDDLDLELGNWKIQFGTGPKVHNGLLSIYQHLGTDQFWHVRIGVDSRKGGRSMPSDRYVLSKFDNNEKNILSKVSTFVILNLVQDLKNKQIVGIPK